MAGAAAGVVQVAVFSRLSADATLKTLTGNHPGNSALARVYDEPPEGAAFPYVVLDVAERANNRFGGKQGSTVDVFVHAISDSRTNKQAQDLLDRVYDLLDNYASLSVSGYTTELVNWLDSQFVRTARSGTPLREGIARYQIDVVKT